MSIFWTPFLYCCEYTIEKRSFYFESKTERNTKKSTKYSTEETKNSLSNK